MHICYIAARLLDNLEADIVYRTCSATPFMAQSNFLIKLDAVAGRSGRLAVVHNLQGLLCTSRPWQLARSPCLVTRFISTEWIICGSKSFWMHCAIWIQYS